MKEIMNGVIRGRETVIFIDFQLSMATGCMLFIFYIYRSTALMYISYFFLGLQYHLLVNILLYVSRRTFSHVYCCPFSETDA